MTPHVLFLQSKASKASLAHLQVLNPFQDTVGFVSYLSM